MQGSGSLLLPRLQNSPYFCVFKYARAVKQKVWNEAENRERDWGETLFSLSPHTPYGRVRLARSARIRLLRHALPISLLILRKKPTVLQSSYYQSRLNRLFLKTFLVIVFFGTLLNHELSFDLRCVRNKTHIVKSRY